MDTTDFGERSRTPEPCIIVIFGASGDLTNRKLMPALYNLFRKGGLPEAFCIVGVARTLMDDIAFRAKMRQGLANAGFRLSNWPEFERRLHYHPVIYDDTASYTDLHARLRELEKKQHTQGNRIFSLAMPPALYPTVARQLGQGGLAAENVGRRQWTRLVVEKPFGYDLSSAKELDAAIAESFKEHQVFRIDHYMTKQTAQNILVFRFANALFEPIWNRNYIDHVCINASENLGVEHRAGYYERSGVLRDMFQNHMMELLSLVATEPPSQITAEILRDKKAELFHSLRPFELKDLNSNLVLGQYQAGEIQGERVPGYREEPGVDPDSLTPTYALMRVFVDNWRWQGVPFYIISGKRLRQKVTRIDIQFKPVPHTMFRSIFSGNVTANRLTIGVYPQEGIFLSIQAMKPSAEFFLRTGQLQFSFHEDGEIGKIDAYEIGYADVISGDQTLFWRRDGLELCWRFLDPILKYCESAPNRSGMLHPYAAGSFGPKTAIDVFPKVG